jgi:hypothetical protein
MVFSIYARQESRLSLVTCADRRIMMPSDDGTHKPSDTFSKVHRAGAHAVYYGVGQPLYYKAGTAVFDAIALTGKYLQGNPVEQGFDRDKFQHYLLDAFRTHLDRVQRTDGLPNTRTEAGEPIFFTIGIYYLDRGEFRKLTFDVLYEKWEKPITSIRMEDRSRLAFDPIGGGNDLIRLFRGHEPSVQHYLSDYEVLGRYSDLWALNGPKDPPPLKDAIEFAKASIRVVNDMGERGIITLNTVSAQSDCIVLCCAGVTSAPVTPARH